MAHFVIAPHYYMKKIYLIRHGESEGNLNATWQGKNGALTERGRKQAQLVAQRLVTLPFGKIVSSSMQRAKETAEIISAHTNKDIEISDLFAERRRPSAQIGMSRTDPASIDVDRETATRFAEPGWRYADEENFEDMKVRAASALAYLINHPEQNITVVTHGYFMRIMLAYALAGETLTPELCRHFLTSLRTANTGITQFIYNEVQERPWQLSMWNDHSHLIDE